MGPQDYIYAADTANIQAGGKSFFDQAQDALTYGAGAAVVSGVQSIYNTGVDVANYFGAGADRVDTAKWLTEVDRNWGQYYQENKNVIDTVGFIGTSFIPGGLAVKGLNAFRRGESAGAFARALNFTTTQQTKNLDAALQALASPEGTVISRLNQNFIKSIAWGVGDNAIQIAAFELATAATMKANPLLDGSSYGDILWDVAKTSMWGGLGVGAIEGLFINRITKDATKAISAQGGKYQNMLTAFDRVDLTAGEKAIGMMDNILALPKEILETDQRLGFSYRLGGKAYEVELKTGVKNQKQLENTINSAMTKFEDLVNNSLSADPGVGRGFAQAMLKLVQDGKGAGKDATALRQRLGDYLFNLDSIEGAISSSVVPETLYYVNKNTAKLTKEKAFQQGFVSTTKSSPTDQAYRVVGNPDDLKVSYIGQNHVLVREAFEDGYDIAFKPDGSWAINPKSGIIRPTTESPVYQRFLRIDSGETSETAVLSAADIGTKESPITVFGDRVRTGERQFKFSVELPTVERDGKKMVKSMDSVEVSARHLWASRLERVEGTIHESDFSLLDRMSLGKTSVDDTTRIKLIGVEEPVVWKDVGNFDEWLFNNKVDTLRKMAEKETFNVTEAAYRLNTTPQWVQDVVASKFDTQLKRLADGAPDLSTGWQRNLDSYAERDNVVLNYRKTSDLITDDFGNMVQVPREQKFMQNYNQAYLSDMVGYNNFVTGQQAYAYQVKLATDRLDIAFANVFGQEADRFFAPTAEMLSGKADQLGAGAGFASFANADYGDLLRAWAQYNGKQVHELSRTMVNANLNRLQPYLAQIKTSPTDAAELAAVVTRLRRSPEAYKLIGADYGLDGWYMVDKRILGKQMSVEDIAAIKDAAVTGTQGNIKAFRIDSDLVGQFLKEHMAINTENIAKRKVLLNAQGVTSNIAEDTLYAPPIDTRRVPFFAFVRAEDGRLFGTSEVHMITAKNAAELQRLASEVPPGFRVIFKKDSEAFHKAKGDYEYSRAINDSAVNSSLKREGRLGDYMPSFQAEDVLEDFVNYHQRQATQLVRDGVSTKFSQTFTELRRLSDQYTAASSSKMEHISKLFNRGVVDPFDDYIKTALDISKRSEFTVLHELNEFVDSLGTRAYSAIQQAGTQAKKGDISWEEANSLLERYGLPAPFTSQRSFEVAQTVPDRNLVKTALHKANMALATVTLRFDAVNSLMNIISTPIMLGTELSSIKRSIKDAPEIAGKLTELTSVKVPGQEAAIPSMSKLVFDAVRNYWGPEKKVLLERYKRNGDIKDVLSQYHEMVDDLSLYPKLVPSKLAENADKWTERISTGFGNNFAEQFTRFVSADVMRQITEPLVAAGRMGLQEQNMYISTFVNRVQGNYIASQRPILFQGTLGSAVGLFQTYQFNLLQQLFRHIEDRNLKTIAVMGGLQTSLFGLNGLPFFDAVNTHIIGNASINAGHRDIYSLATEAAGKEMGDWLMYGTPSALPLFGGKGPALYTRGDINPRHPTIVPVVPQDIPAVDGTIRFVSNLLNVGKKLSAGGDVTRTLLEGLEHNSVSRPLAGLAQALQGYSTTSQGSLIAANHDLWSISNAGRVLGAKPLDESVMLNAKFRMESYKAQDSAAREALGAAVKTAVRGGKAPTDEQMIKFMGEYAAHGGRADKFAASLQRWTNDANHSILNKMSNQLASPYGQRLVEIMGGTRMDEDF